MESLKKGTIDMNLYLVINNIVRGYDTYDSMVVSAKSTKDARTIHPSMNFNICIKDNEWVFTRKDGSRFNCDNSDWVEAKDIDKLQVKYLGKTKLERGVILSSFNAG